MKLYRRKRDHAHGTEVESSVSLDRLAELVKNNLVLDINRCVAEVWLVCSDRRVKNTFASAKLLVIEADVHSFHAP
jgi:hypothetical protein